MNDKVLNNISYGLFVLFANDGKDNGCIINTVTQVTMIPKKLTIAVSKENYTHDMITKTKKFNISILSNEGDFSIYERFGFSSGRDTDKIKDMASLERGSNGILYLTKGSNSYICCEVSDSIDLGSHTLFISDIIDMEILNEVPSVTYDYYHKNIKPQPEEIKSEKVVWRCKICNYIYDSEILPEDYICPICKHPSSDFEKIG